jgi:hypothetical protein
VPTERLVQVHNILASNEHVFTARHKMHRHVYLIEPLKVIWRLR